MRYTIGLFLIVFAAHGSDFILKQNIADFKVQKTPRLRYLAALSVRLHSLDEAKATQKLNPEELELLQQSKALLEQESLKLKELQEHLTPKDIERITKGNPQSFYLRTGKILLFQDFQGCNLEQYKKLKESYSVLDLHRYGVPVMAFVPAAERLYDRQYKTELQRLVRQEERLSEYKTLAETSLDPGLEDELHKRNLIPYAPMKDSERKAEVERFHQSLVRAGLNPLEATDYALNMAAKSPECLGQINRGFLIFVRQDFAREQVDHFERKYVERMKVKDARKPQDVVELTDTKDPYLRSINDPWGSPLRIDGGRIVSPGEDLQLGTEDDIRSDLL